MGGAESRRQLHPGATQVVVRSFFWREFGPSRNWPDPGPAVCCPTASWRRHPLRSGTGGEFRSQGAHCRDAGDETVEYSRYRAPSAMDRGECPAGRAFLVEIEDVAEGPH